MKKKMLLVGLVTGLAVTMTGCGSKNYTLTTEQNDQIADYIANVMLERSYDNAWKYRKAKNSLAMDNSLNNGSLNKPSANSNGSNTGNQNSNTNGTSNGVANGDAQSTDPLNTLGQKLELNGAKITYKTYEVGDRYPTGEYVICVPANPGCKILAVEFNIQNQSSDDIVVNSKESDISINLSLNGETVKQETTILKNDISQLSDVTIKATETYKAVAIFQIKEEQSDNLSKMTAGIYAGGTSLGTVTLY